MSDWEIKLNRGLGQVSFGMTPYSVSEFSSIYGDDAVVQEYGNSAEIFVEDLGPFADMFSAEDLLGAIAAERDFDKETADLVGELRQRPYILNLEYRQGKLSSIGLRDDCRVLHHGDMVLFDVPPKTALEYFQELNGGSRVYGEDVIFDKIGLLLSGFYFQNEQGSWRFHSTRNAGSETRFVTLFAPHELHRFLNNEFEIIDFRTR